MENKIIGIFVTPEEKLSREVLECDCGIPQKGYRWIFKNTIAMEKFIGFFEEMEQLKDI